MGQIASFRTTLGSGTISETTAFEHRMTGEGKIAIAALSASTNTRVKVKYVFDNAGGETPTAADVDTLDLTQNVLTILNLDFPLGVIRVTYDDNGSSMSGGALKIDAHAK
mgnify:CR=1 FL=1|tara:strand:+ start:95 stop:424 length:330 start_codon:yes stop_codon:yes gene_type:complete